MYRHKIEKSYNRENFHLDPKAYECKFRDYISETDVLMNGIYWDVDVPRLFELEDVSRPGFKIQTISDITDDANGSVPINLGDQTIEDPVYGVDRNTLEKTAPYLPNSIDVVAVGNLPNELPRDASKYFGEQLIKHILKDVIAGGSETIGRATIAKDGELTQRFDYLQDYAKGV